MRLGRKRLLCRLLVALTERRLEVPGAALSARALFEVGWPGESQTLEEAAHNRLRVAMRRLRATGLEARIVTDESGGYMLDPEIPVAWLEPIT